MEIKKFILKKGDERLMSNDFDRTIIDVFFKRFSKVVIEGSRIICQIGLGVQWDYKTAGKSYKLAAEEGHANAQ